MNPFQHDNSVCDVIPGGGGIETFVFLCSLTASHGSRLAKQASSERVVILASEVEWN